MNRPQYLGLVAVLAIFGLIGGSVATWLGSPSTVLAAESQTQDRSSDNGKCVGMALKADGSRVYRIFENGVVEERRATLPDEWTPLLSADTRR